MGPKIRYSLAAHLKTM